MADAARLVGDLDDFSRASDELSHLQWIPIDEARGFKPGDFVTVRVAEPELRGVARVPAAAVAAMFSGVGRVLHPGAQFLLYGPFNYDGQFTSPSNRDFDARLRAYDPAMGVRDVAWLTELATASAMALAEDIEMPVNNRLLIWQKA